MAGGRQGGRLGDRTLGDSLSAIREVFFTFLRLGLTSFGGPVAHLSYFHAECVVRRRWLDDKTFGDIVALCQFLPGPASSQVGLCLGMRRAGFCGALAAWTGFTAPSAALMIGFALGLNLMNSKPFLHGLKIVAVAVVAQAVWAMARKFCPDFFRAAVALTAAALALALPGAPGQIGALVGAAAAGWAALPPQAAPAALDILVDRRVGFFAGALFLLLLLGPLALSLSPGAEKLAAIYRSGALVFGGGHVVLPLLREALVAPGFIGESAFIDGYGAAQALPGPLFAFAAYLGAVMDGVWGGLLALAAIYLPGVLLLFAALPFWAQIRAHPGASQALAGVNAAVVGLLFAAFCTPIWTSAIFSPRDALLAAGAFALLVFAKAPPWAVVLGGAVAAQALP
ncbi:chromate transporter [Rhodoblastus acidophilus]|uniref:chromate efflux transporter n=1 Tax=Rhodoblastus acidophilus TaxID=1074 RepID=UPI002223F8A2|nr:chromate efflux transporter [Rhodoblastus acidophilus]MCW2331855.1 chromate transporter [Rhodoblastus acidophilus]